jgi:hypothetical protein
MTRFLEAARTTPLGAWLDGTVRRWQVIPLYLALATIVWVYQDKRDYAACASKVESRGEVRGAFNGVYDLLDPEHTHVKVNALRADLDAQYPELSLKDC